MQYKIPTLPLALDLESKKVLKKAILANKKLAELKAAAKTIPSEEILINTLSLQESKDSSEVEQIITTHDELFKFDSKKSEGFSLAAKEVQNYNKALFFGFREVAQKKLITTNLLIKIVQIITERKKGLRDAPGTNLKNQVGDVIYEPPQAKSEIEKMMQNLEIFVNNPNISDQDPLVKMAIIHHQFESIHPFFDGNGRTGRILNILYLILADTLELPILYLSRYIIRKKSKYYELIQKVRDEGDWEEWILFMLEAVEDTAGSTIETIEKIRILMQDYKSILRSKESKIYSHELLNTVFQHPYTKIEFVMQAESISRPTASKHLKKLVDLGLLQLVKHKNSHYYLNTKLIDILIKV